MNFKFYLVIILFNCYMSLLIFWSTICWITNHPKTWQLKKNIISQLLWLGIQKQLSWMVLIQGLSWGYSQDVIQSCFSHPKSWLGLKKSLPRWLTHMAVWQKVSVPWWLLLPIWVSPHICWCVFLVWQMAFLRGSDSSQSTEQAWMPFKA